MPQDQEGRAVASDVAAIKDFIRAANQLIGAGENEDRIRQHLISRVRAMFPDSPTWIDEHIRGGETALKFHRERGGTTGFVDNLVGLTAIEYEPDLRRHDRFIGGLEQVKEYCAGLLNRGAAQSQVVGVLSDTVRWHAYRVSSVRGERPNLGKADIDLEPIGEADCSPGDDLAADRLTAFLTQHLRRLGSRPLDASSMATDLGFTSPLCVRHVEGLRQVNEAAEAGNPGYADLIRGLWQRYVAPVQQAAGRPFDSDEYVRELYLLTLAKLVCANALERRARLDDPKHIADILSGRHFRRMGLTNLVEYDYFGWITSDATLVSRLVPVARAIQRDLLAYDFAHVPAEDLFGRLMTQLASRSQRILLGQEWTPPWLARKLVFATLDGLGDRAPRVIDPCCGSGAILVESLKAAKARHPRGVGESVADWAKRLTSFVTGFDIDPLAVLLAKVSWVLAVRDDFEALGGAPLTIPVFHADSLFSATPLGPVPGVADGSIAVDLDGNLVALPACLFTQPWRPIFDRIIDAASSLATAGPANAETVVGRLITEANIQCTEDERLAVSTAVFRLAETLADLHARGRNGIWSFLIRNSYRPSLLAGDFNALVSNPPWLTLSRLGDNPYAEPLKELGGRYNLLAASQARLHLELALVFLVHAARHYLGPGARIACILPETVLDGEHLRPFRERGYAAPGSDVQLTVTEVWEVPVGVFSNRAAVLLGLMEGALPNWPLPGRVLGRGDGQPDLATEFFQSTLGVRSVWTRNPQDGEDEVHEPANFRQGADIMPRTVFFHDTWPDADPEMVRLMPVDAASPNHFLVADAKRDADFRLPQPCRVPRQLLARVYTSKMLVPFHVSAPAHAVVPAKRGGDGRWSPLAAADVLAMPGDFPSTDAAVREMALCIAKGQAQRVPDLQHALDLIWLTMETVRRKMSVQRLLAPDEHLVLFGAGGGVVCAASIELAEFEDMLPSLAIDQTLYWTTVGTADEADYLTAALNSSAVAGRIAPFQPEGEFGKRHIHELPVQVIPPYDPSSAEACALRDAGRQLQRELEARLAAEPALRTALHDPNGSLPSRRRRVRRLLAELPTFGAYEAAAFALLNREA